MHIKKDLTKRLFIVYLALVKNYYDLMSVGAALFVRIETAQKNLIFLSFLGKIRCETRLFFLLNSDNYFVLLYKFDYYG